MKDEIHNHLGVLTRDNLILYLRDIGFKQYRPRTTSWKSALIASNNSQTIYFLIGKRSIDFKFYDYVNETVVDSEGKLYTNDGIMVRNNYYESELHVHRLILNIASLFIGNEVIPDSLMAGQGTSLKDKHAADTASLEMRATRPTKTDRDDMLDIYDVTANEYGEDAYLGGGMWIGSDGSLSDKGR